MAQILVVEDNETMREGIAEILLRMGHDPKTASGGRMGVEMYASLMPEFVITDLKMEDLDGVEVLRQIKAISSDAMVLVITAFGTIETAVEAMKLGAFDFITKPFSPDLLRVKVNAALEFVRTRSENRFLREELGKQYSSTLVGSSEIWAHLMDQVKRVAPTESTVLITGESGTGKELIARAIHTDSRRAQKPFIKVDCASLAEGVLESELFGHERGAFTGATQRKQGRFELAHEGTLFLDEVGELTPALQLKLLRVLQDRSFERVGGNRTIHVDVRIVSATNKNLEDEVKTGRFREDLFYRLQVVPIHVPALRERRDDIPILANHFLHSWAERTGRKLALTDEARALLVNYSWPGNVRELEHLIERIEVLHRGTIIDAAALEGILKKPSHHVDLNELPPGTTLNEALDQLERQLILKAYQEANGVKTRTAELLGIKASALYYKLEKYGIEPKSS